MNTLKTSVTFLLQKNMKFQRVTEVMLVLMTSVTTNCECSFVFPTCQFLLWTEHSWSMHIIVLHHCGGQKWPCIWRCTPVNTAYLKDFTMAPQICQPKTCSFAWRKLWLLWSFCVIMDCNNFIKYSLISKKLVAVFRVECSAIIINILWEAN